VSENSAWIPFLTPFVHFTYCFGTSFVRSKGSPLLIGGILAHGIAIPFYFRAMNEGLFYLAILPLLLTVCWFSMYFRRKR